jgi:hypothetical protein
VQRTTAADNKGIGSLSWLNTHGKVALKLSATKHDSGAEAAAAAAAAASCE